jgi:hypothetical protein
MRNATTALPFCRFMRNATTVLSSVALTLPRLDDVGR